MACPTILLFHLFARPRRTTSYAVDGGYFASPAGSGWQHNCKRGRAPHTRYDIHRCSKGSELVVAATTSVSTIR